MLKVFSDHCTNVSIIAVQSAKQQPFRCDHRPIKFDGFYSFSHIFSYWEFCFHLFLFGFIIY